MPKKGSDKKKMMANKTSSNIPKTAIEKKRWIQARKIVAKETGKYKDDEIPWGLVNHIYETQNKANKTASKESVRKTKTSKAVRQYPVQATTKTRRGKPRTGTLTRRPISVLQ